MPEEILPEGLFAERYRIERVGGRGGMVCSALSRFPVRVVEKG